MQTISFLLFRLLAFVVQNHLKREKKRKYFFPFWLTKILVKISSGVRLCCDPTLSRLDKARITFFPSSS